MEPAQGKVIIGGREDWAGALVAADVIHIRARLLDAPILKAPFDHIIVPDFLPADLYADLERALAQVPPAPGRNSVILTNFEVPADRLTPAVKRLRAALTDAGILQIILDRFNHVLEPLMNDGRQDGGWASIDAASVFPRVELMRDDNFMTLPPHTDHNGRLFAALLYMPTDDTQRDLGTVLYRPRDPEMRCDGTKSHDFSLFDEAVTAPFSKNTLCLFARSDVSFHGFPRRPDAADRRAVQWSALRDGHF
jgi:hypothetical protein